MKQFYKPSLAIVGATCLAIAAVGMAQRLPDLNSGPAARDATQLSSVFRQVSQDVLPSIVSIETRGRSVAIQRELPFGEDHPFRKFFESDPRWQQHFKNQSPDDNVRQGKGSGFVIDRSGVVMTNAHVVRDAVEILIRMHDGREFMASSWKADPGSDLAVVHFDAPNDLRTLKLGDSDLMETGDWVLALGAPFGLDMSVTAGIISGKGRGLGNQRSEFLQTDAAINPGNSGGPLVNIKGEVVGINTAISTRSGGYDGVGFAIPINKAKWIGKQLRESGHVRRAFLGVRIQSVTPDLAEKFQTRPGAGAIVTNILPNSPAENSELRTGDVILRMAGKNVNSTRNLQGIVEQLEIDKPYPMTILRDGKQINTSITVNEMPGDYLTAGVDTSNTEPQIPRDADDGLGMELVELKTDTARQLGVDPNSGVLIAAVKPGSPAARGGLSPGDVIEKVGSKAIRNLEDYEKEITRTSKDDSVLLFVNSQGSFHFVVVKRKS
ncbi:MAG: trypsin-like peptidase domain-containing protein [Planctomycetaceae bacterium]